MDAIASTAFGLDIDSQKNPNDPFVRNIDEVFKLRPLARIPIIISAIAPGVGRWLYKLGLSQWPSKTVQFYDDVGKALIEERRNNKMNRVDFLQLLMEAEFDGENDVSTQNGGTDTKNTGKSQKMKLTDDEVNGQAFVFFLAGFETTSSLLRYAAYILALHPDIDDKLWSEIEECLGQDEPTYENLGKLKYMEQFINEVLRCYPPVPRLSRTTKEDICINGMNIPKGTSVQIPAWTIQHDPELYENPFKFDPDRFALDKKGSSDNVSFLAFGIGPRHCIGMRLALVEAKIALVYVLRKVRFVKSEQTQVPLDLNHFGILRPKTPVAVGIRSR